MKEAIVKRRYFLRYMYCYHGISMALKVLDEGVFNSFKSLHTKRQIMKEQNAKHRHHVLFGFVSDKFH